MKDIIQSITLLAILLFIFSCGSSKDDTGYFENNKTIFVSKQKGDNENGQGTKEYPFKTLSYAISQRNNERYIALSGGRYNYSENEDYTINIPNGLNIVKSDENNESININIGKLILNGNSHLELLTIEDTLIYSNSGSNKIQECFIIGESSIRLLNTSKLELKNTTVANNPSIAIEVTQNSSLTLNESNISNNYIGIIIKDRGDMKSYYPKTEILNNQECDFLHTGIKNITLNNIKWNNKIKNLTVSNICEDGNDIVNIGNAIINYDEQVPLPNTTSFETKYHNFIIKPRFGETLTGNYHAIEYTNHRREYIKIAIWNKYPIIINNTIKNIDDIIWSWDSGENFLGEINGEIGHTSFSLETGIYYIVIWEWDDDGNKVISSSNISYFYVDTLN